MRYLLMTLIRGEPFALAEGDADYILGVIIEHQRTGMLYFWVEVLE